MISEGVDPEHFTARQCQSLIARLLTSMSEREIQEWLTDVLPRQESLTATVVSILESLLRANGIDFLAVSGRTKTFDSTNEKVRRKNYREPKTQLTDLSGIRVILYFESQVDRASKVVEDAFRVDAENSKNRDANLTVDQIGYRSVHYVCDLGPSRTCLPEYADLTDLKFEVQLRTVLQHAWAELAHDRNYKFSGKLPRPIERQLYLYAGMLEIADKGFDSLSHQIDTYIDEVKQKTEAGQLDIELDSVSLDQFVQSWARDAGVILRPPPDKDASRQLLEELSDYGIRTLEDLRAIIPPKYTDAAKQREIRPNIFSVLRDWMIMHDYARYRDKAWKKAWYGFGDWDECNTDRAFYRHVVGDERTAAIFGIFERKPFESV